MTAGAQSEQLLASLVVQYLEEAGHDVYQEVPCSTGAADIVALVGRGREVWIVETKTSWSFDLLEQCLARKRDAHRVFAAAPACRNHRESIFGALGIGQFVVRPDMGGSRWRGQVSLRGGMPPRTSPDPRMGRLLRSSLRPQHKAPLAGLAGGGGRWTAFRETCSQVGDFVAKNPGATLKEVVARVGHHYSSAASARSSIAHWIARGMVPGVRVEQSGRAMRLFPVEKP